MILVGKLLLLSLPAEIESPETTPDESNPLLSKDRFLFFLHIEPWWKDSFAGKLHGRIWNEDVNLIRLP